jgi:hypothetical protein
METCFTLFNDMDAVAVGRRVPPRSTTEILVLSGGTPMRFDGKTTRMALTGAVGLAAATLLAPAAGAAVFGETFAYTGGGQDQALRAAGWCGGNAGDAFCDNPVAGKGSANEGGEGAISAGGRGPDGAIGFAFWSQTGIGADSFLYTDRVSFEAGDVPTVTWFQRDSARGGVSDPARLALRVGDDWYISGRTFGHVGTDGDDWQRQEATLADLDWFVRAQSGDTLPGGGVAAAMANLPADASVSALGFWWDGPKVATSRFDDVSAVPIPGAAVLLGTGVAALGWARRRRAAA